MENKINYAIIPASGKGIRFRPITSVISKEMLPLNGVPVVQYSVLECINAGINKIAIIVRQNDNLIKKYFLSQPQFKNLIVNEFTNNKDSKEIFIKECSLPQKGNAMSLLELENILINKKFAVLFPDDVIFGTNPIKDLLAAMQKNPKCVSALTYTEVPVSEIHNYGNLEINTQTGIISKILQKPLREIMSKYVIVSRIITDSKIFKYLEKLDEKDLGIALGFQCQEKEVIGCKLTGEWVSVDSPTNYANAVITALKYIN